MPDGAKTLLVILLIPFLLGVGHDIYLNYFSDDEKIREVKALRINPAKFLVSDMGWVWNEYAPNMMQSVRDMVEPSTWKSTFDPVLQLPTMIVGLIPWAITFAYLIFARLAGFWPCAGVGASFGRGSKGSEYAVYEKDKAKKMKFKR